MPSSPGVQYAPGDIVFQFLKSAALGKEHIIMKRTFCFLLILIFVFSGSLPAFAIKKEADLFLYNGEEQLFSIQNAALTATGEYLFTENAVFELDNPPKGKWNQYQLRYSSNMPLSGIFRYETDGQEKEELFYLEAGEEMVFTSYIDGYLDGQSAQTLRSLTFTSIQGEETTFAFTSLRLPANKHILKRYCIWKMSVTRQESTSVGAARSVVLRTNNLQWKDLAIF